MRDRLPDIEMNLRTVGTGKTWTCQLYYHPSPPYYDDTQE